jgi:hypothetical protein
VLLVDLFAEFSDSADELVKLAEGFTKMLARSPLDARSPDEIGIVPKFARRT